MYGYAECLACHKVAEKSRFVRKFGIRAIYIVPIVLILLSISGSGVNQKTFLAICLGSLVVRQLFLYFSTPVPYTGEFTVGPSRAERLLAPFMLVAVVVFFIYATYWLFTAP